MKRWYWTYLFFNARDVLSVSCTSAKILERSARI
jgi:hypothetical protein